MCQTDSTANNSIYFYKTVITEYLGIRIRVTTGQGHTTLRKEYKSGVR